MRIVHEHVVVKNQLKLFSMHERKLFDLSCLTCQVLEFERGISLAIVKVVRMFICVLLERSASCAGVALAQPTQGESSLAVRRDGCGQLKVAD